MLFEIRMKRVHAPRGKKTFETSKNRLMSSRGMFAYDSIPVICVGVDISTYALLTGGRS